MAVVGAAIAISVPVLASGASSDGSDAAAPANANSAADAALPFIAADGATRAETGIDPGTLTAADGAKFARTGSITLAIETSGAGTVSAVGTSQVGTAATDSSEGWVEVGKDSERITEPASVEATGAGVVELTLRLTPAARAAYAAGADDEMLLEISSSSASGSLVNFVPMGG